MKTIINTPIFHYPSHFYTGDNLSQFFPAKYLWYHCNIKNKEFHNPVYNFRLKDTLKIDFAFYPEHPLHLYFKKPKWINEFVECKNKIEANKIARNYDFFINNYRYRGAIPPEMNWGYSKDLQNLELSLIAYTHKGAYDYGIYVDDLELNEKYNDFLKRISRKINPNKRPIIAIHHRGNDPWNRHLSNSIEHNEQLLFRLLDVYPDHIFVLLGESWKYFLHPKIKYLDRYINKTKIMKSLGEYTASLQYILSLYFCRDLEIVFAGMSGFTLNLESIRPLHLMPPIPAFWGPKTFTGIDTCIEAQKDWKCQEFIEYRKENPKDEAFRHDCHHFLYYSRDEEILLPYCMDYPNDNAKIFELLGKLELKYKKNDIVKNILSRAIINCKKDVRIKDKLTLFQYSYSYIKNNRAFVASQAKKMFVKAFNRLRNVFSLNWIKEKLNRLRSVLSLNWIKEKLRGTLIYIIYKKFIKR